MDKSFSDFLTYPCLTVYSFILPAILVLCFLFPNYNVHAQEINFGEFSSKYSVAITELNPAEDLSFGTIIQNEGVVELDINEAKVLEIEGVKYLDVLVDIIADEYLILDSNPTCSTDNCRITFDLETAFANRGQNNIGHATIMNGVGTNMTSAYFPILARGNQPPGPPPTPDYEGYDPSQFNETAYLYIYGSLTVGNVDAGSYSANITITVSYD